MEGTGLLLHFRMTLMRLEEERVGDVFMMILCVCLLQGGFGCMESVGTLMLLYMTCIEVVCIWGTAPV